jgi:transposase-like protein
VIENVSAKTILASISAWVESGATVYTDQAPAYIGLGRDYGHFSVNHGTGEYVNGDVHTNGIENFWSLYKRAWKGTCTHNAPKAHRALRG